MVSNRLAMLIIFDLQINNGKIYGSQLHDWIVEILPYKLNINTALSESMMFLFMLAQRPTCPIYFIIIIVVFILLLVILFQFFFKLFYRFYYHHCSPEMF